jgi:beta-mannanase
MSSEHHHNEDIHFSRHDFSNIEDMRLARIRNYDENMDKLAFTANFMGMVVVFMIAAIMLAILFVGSMEIAYHYFGWAHEKP